MGVASLKFRPALRTYKPKHGGFFNYFWTAACRAMVEQAKKDIDRENIRGLKGPTLDDEKDSMTATLENPDLIDLDDAIRRLPPAERHILEALEGRGVKPQTERAIARTLRIEIENVAAIRRAIYERLQKQVASGKRPGRPSEAHVRAVVEIARRLRAQGMSWKEIVEHLWHHHGRKLTPDAVRMAVKRKNEHK